MAASFSNSRRGRMLLDVSSSSPMRSGRSVSRPKKRMSCGVPFSITLKSLLIEIGDEIVLFVRDRDDEMNEAGGDFDRGLTGRCDWPGFEAAGCAAKRGMR